MTDHRLVLVQWEDSHSDSGWRDLDGEPEGFHPGGTWSGLTERLLEDRASVCRSVGWLVLDGERVKVVAPHLAGPDVGVPLQGCGVMAIPTRAVLRIVRLQETDMRGTIETPALPSTR